MIYRPMDDDKDLVEDVFDQENDLKIDRNQFFQDTLYDRLRTDKANTSSENEKSIKCAIFNKFTCFFKCKTTTIT